MEQELGQALQHKQHRHGLQRRVEASLLHSVSLGPGQQKKRANKHETTTPVQEKRTKPQRLCRCGAGLEEHANGADQNEEEGKTLSQSQRVFL